MVILNILIRLFFIIVFFGFCLVVAVIRERANSRRNEIKENITLLEVFEEYKTNAGITTKVRLCKRSTNATSYNGFATLKGFRFPVDTIELEPKVINSFNTADAKTLSAGKRLLGHEFSHIKNADNHTNVWKAVMFSFNTIAILFNYHQLRYLAFHIIAELRADIEGSWDIAKLNEDQIKLSFDYCIEGKYNKSDFEMTEEEKDEYDKKSMKNGYVSYISRKDITLRYMVLNEALIEEVMVKFFSHFDLNKAQQDKIRKDLIERFCKTESIDSTQT